MSSLPPERLAELPPTVWETTARRMEVVSSFLSQNDRSTASIQAHAALLDVSRPMFYKLLAQWNNWEAAGDAVRSRETRRSCRPTATAITREAIALCGPGATQAAVVERTAAIASERGVAAPERGLVRREHLRLRAGAALERRLGIHNSRVIDASPLAVRVRGAGGDRLAVLTAVIDIASGDVDDWIITAGAAAEGQLAELIHRAARVDRPQTLHATSAVPAIARLIPLEKLPTRRLRGGAPLLAAVGGRLARVSFLPRADPERPDPFLPLVKLDDVAAVASVSLSVGRIP